MAELNQTQVAQNNWRRYLEARDMTGHDDYIELADKCDAFYSGEQWDEETLARLGDRPALTINMALRTINAIRGNYSKTRADIVAKPRKGASEQQAETLTAVIDYVLDLNDYAHVEQMVFDDGIIDDRGFFDVRMSYDDNVLGEIQIRSRDPRTVVLDPDATDYDPDTWNEVTVTDWYSIDDIKVLYGEKAAEEIGRYVDMGMFFGAESIRFGGARAGRSWSDQATSDAIASVRIIDRQYRRLRMVREFVDLSTGDTRPIPDDWDEERIQAIKEQYGLAVRKRMAKRIRWTVTADNAVLFDDWSPYEHFTIVPYFPYFRRGKPTGVMRHLLSPQEQLNKTESQELHIINTTSNSGWMVEAGSLVNMTEEELEERGAETGLVVVYGRNRPAPTKIQPNHVPTGIDQIAAKAATYVADIPGVSPLIGSAVSPDVSGVAVQRSTDIAVTGLQPVFDNLNYTRRLLAHRILKLIQRFYTEPRLLHIVDRTATDGEAQRTVTVNTNELDRVTVGKYDIKVASVPAQDTFEERQFAHLLEMRNAGIAIPDHYIIEHAPLARKRQIAEEVKNLQGLGEPSPEQAQMQQMMAEISMRTAQAELAELESKVQRLTAEAELMRAKAGATVLEAQTDAARAQFDMQDRRDRLLADLRKTVANLQNKLELASLHTQAKVDLTRYNRVSKVAEAEAKASKEINDGPRYQ